MKEYLKLFPIAKKYYKSFLLGFAAMIFYAIFSGISVTVFIPLIDKILVKKNNNNYSIQGSNSLFQSLKDIKDIVLIDLKSINFSGSFKDDLNNIKNITIKIKSDIAYFIDKSTPKTNLKLICFTIIIIFLIKNIFFYINKFIFIKIENAVTRDLRNIIYSKILNYPLSYFKKMQTGDIISRIIQDVQVVNSIIIVNLTKAVRDIFVVLIYISIALMLNYKLFLFTFLVIPPMGFFLDMLGKKLKKYSKRIQEKISDIYSLLQETILGISVVKAFANEDYEISRFKDENQKYYKSMVKLWSYNSLNIPISELSSAGIIVLVLWYGTMQVINPNSSFTTGDFFAFLAAIFSMLHPLKEIAATFNDIQRGKPALSRVLELIEYKNEMLEASNPVILNEFKDKITIDNISFNYENDEKSLFDNFSFEIKKGSKVALVGPSGSGKTTLALLLPRFYDVQKGAIYIDGINIKDISIKSLRKLFGIVNQDIILFNDTIANNVNYGKEDIPFEKIVEACKVANIHDFIMSLPEQYNTNIGERGVRLSGGQKQRISIARAVLKNPPILIFDEATSALDTESESLVQEAIDKLLIGRTNIIIAHRLSTIINSDIIVVLNDGKIIDYGRHEELYERCAFYKKLYDLQFKI